MRTLLSRVVALPLAAALLLGPAEAAFATDCAKEYMGCISDAGALPGLFRNLAEIECFAEYVGCVAEKIIVS
ncbi:MAG: hypothetical protein HY561_08305 [Gemmatimonadetes bacterium]|nr:hypothetical protein [Gemmatimonadota bacterium]